MIPVQRDTVYIASSLRLSLSVPSDRRVVLSPNLSRARWIRRHPFPFDNMEALWEVSCKGDCIRLSNLGGTAYGHRLPRKYTPLLLRSSSPAWASVERTLGLELER